MTLARSIPNKIVGQGQIQGLAVVLDYPNTFAWNTKRHLQSDEFRLLDAGLKATGFDLDGIWITFGIPTPISGKKASQAEVYQGAMHIKEELSRVKPSKILCMGGVAHSVLEVLRVPDYEKAGYGPPPANPRQVRGLGRMIPIADYETYCVTTIPLYMVLSDPELFKDLSYDFYKLLKKGAVDPLPRVRQMIVHSPDDLLRGFKAIKDSPVISCDTETSGLHPWDDDIEAIGFGVLDEDGKGVKTVIIPYELIHDADIKAFTADFLLGKTDATFVFHNAKFDLQFLTRWLGQSLSRMKISDTLLVNYLLDERPVNSASSPHGLKTISRIRYDAPDYKFDFKRFWALAKENRNWATLYEYLSLDLFYTARLHRDIMIEFGELETEDPNVGTTLRKVLLPGTKSLAEIELLGVRIDTGYLKELGAKLEADLVRAVETVKLVSLELGVPSAEVSTFNPGSPQQVASLLFGRLNLPSNRQKSTGKEVLEELGYKLRTTMKVAQAERKAELLDAILDYRGLSKLIGTYVHGILEQVDQNGYLHGSFNIPGTATGRLSSQDPNLQNIPQVKGLEIRRAFIPRPGFTWVKVDYSQLEYRVAAFLSQDPVMMKAYEDGRDIHTEVASRILGIAPEDVTKLQRYFAKFVGFGLLYGRGAVSIALGRELRGQNWSIQDAQNFIDSFLTEFSGLRTWMDKQRAAVSSEQELRTLMGRRRRWPFLTDKSLPEAQRQALNYPIQSLASDFTLTSLIKLHNRSTSDARILITVHDEINFEIRTEFVAAAIPIIVEAMTTNLPVQVNLPIEVEADIGPSWGELSPWKSTELLESNPKSGLLEAGVMI